MPELNLSPEIARLAQELARSAKYDRLSLYHPYDVQKEFHFARGLNGLLADQRLACAGNRSGKTEAGGNETAMHATGRYPKDWKGWKLPAPRKIWVGGKSHEKVRDTSQAKLLGDPFDGDALGSGTIPRECIVECVPKANVPRAFSSVQVRHVLGHIVTIVFKSYDAGPENWMSESVDMVWLDEEPPSAIYSQALTRVLDRQGIIYMTFTPEEGMTEVVTQFMQELKPGQAIVTWGMRDVPHFKKEQIDKYEATLMPHERDMRVRGIPSVGRGMVWPVPWDEIVIRPPVMGIPRQYRRLCAMDFGFQHPTAAVWLAWDTEQDVVYVVDEYKKARVSIKDNAEALTHRGGGWQPIIWPPDMLKEHGSGPDFARQYRDFGANMTAEWFRNPDGSTTVEPGLQAVYQRLVTGKLKVYDHCQEFLKEARLYHYKDDGKVRRANDDLCSALRYGVQSLAFWAIVPPAHAYGFRTEEQPQFAEMGYEIEGRMQPLVN